METLETILAAAADAICADANDMCEFSARAAACVREYNRQRALWVRTRRVVPRGTGETQKTA